MSTLNNYMAAWRRKNYIGNIFQTIQNIINSQVYHAFAKFE